MRSNVFQKSRTKYLLMLVFPLIVSTLSFKPLKQVITFGSLVRLLVALCLTFTVGFYLYVLLASDLHSQESKIITVVLAGGIQTCALSLSVTSAHELATVRFMFHFSHIEVVCYLVGVNFPQLVYALLLYGHHLWGYPYGGKTYLISNSVAYLLILRTVWLYVRRYIDGPDDLTEQTETIKAIAKERPQAAGWQSYFKLFHQLSYPLALVFANEAITSTTTRLFLLAYPFADLETRGCCIRAFFYGFGGLGCLASLSGRLRSHGSLPAKVACNVVLLVGLAAGNVADRPWFSHPAAWQAALAAFGFLSGNVLASAIDLTMGMVDHRKKKQAGFLVFATQCAGFAFSNLFQDLAFL